MSFGSAAQSCSAYNCLNDVDILGSFDFNNAIVTLDSLDRDDIDSFQHLFDGRTMAAGETSALTVDQYLIAAKVLPLAIHEYTHFLDATSTLWGLRHLALMEQAYACSDRLGAKEASFSNAKTFADHCRYIRLPKYYTVVESRVSDDRPWKANMSAGFVFDHQGKPTHQTVLFSRFLNSDDQLIARSPVSTVSLLEASAMAQELLSEYVLLQFAPEDFRLVERSLLNERTRSRLFNRLITEYSVCAHVVSNQQQCLEVLQTFRLCSALVRTALNFPDKAFDRIAKKCPVGRLIEINEDSAFARRMRNGLRGRNLGVLFYLLCKALPSGSYLTNETISKGIADALRTIGCAMESYTSMRNLEAEQLVEKLSSSHFHSISALAEAGYSNLRTLDSLGEIDFFALNLPPAYLGDGDVVQLFNETSNVLRNFDLEASFFELLSGELWVNRFSEACI